MQEIRRITTEELAVAMGQKDRSYGWSGASVYRLQKQGRCYYALVRANGEVDYSTETRLTPLQSKRLGLEEAP